MDNLSNIEPRKVPVFVIDDDGEFLKMISEYLDIVEVPHLSFQDPIEALSKLSFLSEDERPRLIVSDKNMPTMNGFDLLSRIKVNYPNIKVIITSAFGKFKTENEAKRRGAFAFISKPFHLPDFAKIIERALTEDYTHSRK